MMVLRSNFRRDKLYLKWGRGRGPLLFVSLFVSIIAFCCCDNFILYIYFHGSDLELRPMDT